MAMKVKDWKGREGKWEYQEAESDGDDDGGGDGNGGEVEVTEVAGEGLGYDSHREHGKPAENGGSSNCPQFLRL